MNAVRLRRKKTFVSLLHIKPAARQRTCRAYIRLPQSECYNQSGLDIEDPSANNMIFLEKLPVLNEKKCFVNIIQIVPFVMDLTNHRAPTNYWTDLGQTFAYSTALKTLLGTGYWKALIIHFCLSWQSRKLAAVPVGLTSSKRYCIVPKWHINESASLQMSN